MMPLTQSLQSIEQLATEFVARLEQDYQQAQHLNQVNSTVIAVNHHNHQRMPAILQGRAPQTETYSTKGKLQTPDLSSGHIQA